LNNNKSGTRELRDDLEQRLQALRQKYAGILAQHLNLDLTRGKPSSTQLALCDALDGILAHNYLCEDGSDSRNYGGLLGIPEARRLAAEYLGSEIEETMVGGSSSLQLIYQCVVYAHMFGLGKATSWSAEAGDDKVKFLCPVPGYDRHFAICEALDIDMIAVPMNAEGPDMDQVESLLGSDPLIKGIWCVPKYANPDGTVYGDSTVSRLSKLGKLAGKNFLVLWDNAYAVHDLVEKPPELANILDLSRQNGTLDNVIAIGSTSKITFAGAGLAFIASSKQNIENLAKHLSCSSIGPDKINQLRHVRFLKDRHGIRQLMEKHRAILKPKFELVLKHLHKAFAATTLDGKPLGHWSNPEGGYFVLFNTRDGLANKVVKLTAAAGVKLTPAGSTWPYGRDPCDSNIRLAPSFPQLAEIDRAMEVFTLCVEIATLEQASTAAKN
jgi:DNA-binding transcriptional MocR family regulator